MAKILILYSSTDGYTLKICNVLKQVAERNAHQVMIVSVEDVYSVALKAFDKIVIGASIRYGKHGKKIVDFINIHLVLLESKSNAFFSVNIVARKPGKNRPDTNPYMQKFLKRTAWRPQQLAVFAGKLDYPKYNFFDRWVIRFIMLITNGPTDPTAVVEFTEWKEVEIFGQLISDM